MYEFDKETFYEESMPDLLYKVFKYL